MFKNILLVLVVLIAGLAIYVQFQPDSYAVERSAVIPAPPATVFAMVNDFHRWSEWSPWENKDPQIKRTFSEPAAGKGAKYAWVGNDKVGEGDMTITESKPGELIDVDLHFIKPFEGRALTEFRFVPEGAATKVTWKMSGKNNFLGKAMCLVMNMDKTVGGDFETGLANMKAKVVAPAATGSTTSGSPSAAGTASTSPSATGTGS
jgi:hypothetical protein